MSAIADHRGVYHGAGIGPQLLNEGEVVLNDVTGTHFAFDWPPDEAIRFDSFTNYGQFRPVKDVSHNSAIDRRRVTHIHTCSAGVGNRDDRTVVNLTTGGRWLLGLRGRSRLSASGWWRR